MYGPFKAPHGEHWRGVCSYPVSTIPKSTDGWRIISNLSFGGSFFSANGFARQILISERSHISEALHDVP